MSDQPYTGSGQQDTDPVTSPHTGSEPIPTHAEDGHTGGELVTRYENPGIAPHAYRRSDIDPKAAKRREREVATLFGLSTLGTILFIVAYCRRCCSAPGSAWRCSPWARAPSTGPRR
jgi:ubiquinol-cytochrome c reductase iron-sulfur subunit